MENKIYLKDKAAKLVESCGEVVLASISDAGYPRACVVSRIKSDGLRKIYFSTGTTSVKTGNFIDRPKASVCVHSGGDSVTLLGTVAVKTDSETKESCGVIGLSITSPAVQPTQATACWSL